jgi:hypothetical protein
MPSDNVPANAILRPVTNADANTVVAHLRNWPGTDLPDWTLLFDGRSDELPIGFGLFVDDRCVGYIGTIGRTRMLHGNAIAVVNITCWFVEQAWRSRAQELMDAVKAIPRVCITAVTVGPPLLRRYRELGYHELEDAYVLMPRIPGIHSCPLERYIVTHDIGNLRSTDLQEHARRYPLARVLTIRDTISGRSLTLAYITPTRIFKGLTVRTAFLLFVDDHSVFVALQGAVRDAIYRDSGCWLVQVDRHFLPSVPPLSITRPLPVPRMYWAAPGVDIHPTDIDYLFTELALFGV